MPMFCFEFVRNILKNHDPDSSKIGLLGVAYGPELVIQGSQVEDFYKRLSKFFDNIKCQDPYVSFWPELNLKIETKIENFMNNIFDVLIITTGHKDYLKEDSIYNH